MLWTSNGHLLVRVLWVFMDSEQNLCAIVFHEGVSCHLTSTEFVRAIYELPQLLRSERKADERD